jgi:hypothetical protein
MMITLASVIPAVTGSSADELPIGSNVTRAEAAISSLAPRNG